MKFILSILCFFLFAVSCDKQYGGIVIDVDIDFLLQNPNGQDLLDSNTEQNLLNSDIKVYFTENGVEREVYNTNLDCPRNFCILDDGNKKILRMFPLDKVTGSGKDTVRIQWNSLHSDIVVANIIRKESKQSDVTFCDSVWVNDILKFPNKEFYPNRKFVHIIQ